MDNTKVKYGKTLRELLTAVSFDSLVPLILTDKNSSCTPAQYKEAYDILLHTEPSPEGCIDITISRKETYLSAYCVEGLEWEKVIDGDIYFDIGTDVSDAQIAYTLLWHLTFYGYNKRTKEETYRQISSGQRHENIYGILAFATEIRRDWLLADKKTKEDLLQSVEENMDDGIMSYSLTEDQWDSIRHHRTHCNGPKRKRDARLQRKIQRLERTALCENTTSRLLDGQKGTALSRKDLSFLSDADRRCGCEFQSQSFDGKSRLEYLLELMDKYGAAKLDGHVCRIAVRVASSPDYPLSRQELSQITEKIKQSTGIKDYVLSEAEDDTIGKEIQVLMVGPAA